MKLKMLAMASAAAVLSALPAFAQEKALPLAEARAQIGSIVSDPVSMTSVMRQLEPENQASFLADVNAAISKMPGSNEEKAAKFLNVNKAALKGAAKGNLANLVAEVFATVPPEALTLISERFAADLFNRNADPTQTYSDDKYLEIATNLFARIESRTEGTDDAQVRNAFAIAMLVRASGSDYSADSPLVDALIGMLPDEATRNEVKNEWLPAALSESPDYEPMLAEADAGQQPNPELALQLSGPQLLDAMLQDIASSLIDDAHRETTPFSDQAFESFRDPLVESLGEQPPRTSDPSKPWSPSNGRDEQPDHEDLPNRYYY